ncbi:hypothetical protein Tco_0429731 [Tanacetum coccineum]
MVTAIEEPKRLESQSLDELIGNLKVHEMIIKKDSEIVKAKVEKKSFALKAKKVSSDEECSNFSGCDRRRVCTWPVRECPKPPRDKNQRAFDGGSWSDSGEEDDEKVKDKACPVAHVSSEGYSQNSKAYIILNKPDTRKIEESLNMTFDETPPPFKTSPLVDDDLDEEEAIRETEKKNLENNGEDETLEIDEIVNIKES